MWQKTLQLFYDGNWDDPYNETLCFVLQVLSVKVYDTNL